MSGSHSVLLRALSRDNAALLREITLLCPAAMPFMPQQRDSNVSGEERALCAALTDERAQIIPGSSRPDKATRAATNRGEAAQGLEAPRAMPEQQQCLNNPILKRPVFEHCQ